MPLFWKQLASVSSLYILASRIVWSFVFCLALLALKKQIFSIREVFKSKKESFLLFLSGMFICLNWGLYIFTVNSGRILESSIAYYLSPILSILLGVLFYKEKLMSFQWLAVFFAAIGVFVSVLAYGGIPFFAILLCLTFGFYGFIKKNVVSNSDTTIVIETLFLLPFALALLVYYETISKGAFFILEDLQLLLLPLTGVLTSLPLLFFSAGVKKTPFSLIGIIMFTSPTISLLIGVFVYKEPFTITHIITFIFVWMAALFFIIGSLQKRRYPHVC